MNVIPQPLETIYRDGAFTLRADTRIFAGPGAKAEADFLAFLLRPATGFILPVEALRGQPSVGIVLELVSSLGALGPEGYELEVTPDTVRLRASEPAGLFYAGQTLRQLFPPGIFSGSATAPASWTVPALFVRDRPRFAWRGAMLDCCRHFMPLPFIRRFLDLLALHKLNTFHWHLTDDQGWRLEIRKYPRLTEVGAWRRETLIGHNDLQPWTFDGTPHGGFYTQEAVKEIVSYASARHIRVIPEIEMPGHASAAIASYPELGNTGVPIEVAGTWGVHEQIFNPSEDTIRFLQDVLGEVLELFPSPYIHVGGDEAVKRQWKESAFAQARIKELGLSDEHELQSWIIGRMDSFLHGRGRKLVGWDEILEGGLAPNATVMSWRGVKGGIAAAKAGHDVVMASNTHAYLDHYQSEDRAHEPLAISGYTSLEKVYSFDPVPAELTPEEASHVLGSQGQLWTEYIGGPSHVEYMAFPRLTALSEVCWTSRDLMAYAGFRRRLEEHLLRLDRLGVNYRKP